MKNNETTNYKQEINCQKMDTEIINNLIVSLKQTDKGQNRKLRLVYFLFFIAGLLFIIATGLKISLNNINQLIIANLFVIALIIIALLLRNKYVNAYKIDYTLPLLNVLKKAEHRYRFWNNEWIFIVVLIMLINMVVSIVFNLIPFSDQWTPLRLTILAQLIYLPLLGLVFLLEWTSWKKHQKPLWKKTLQMIKELEN